jgi:polysaccharide export outer membrane protein
MRTTTGSGLERLARSALGLALAAACAACATAAPFTWVDRLPAEPEQAAEYRIAPGDVLAVSVWNQDNISVPRARVREDGKISVAFLQDVDVVGQTPNELAARLQARLKAFIVSPVVTVRVEEVHPLRVTVLGKVGRTGTFDLPLGAGVVQALAAASGLSDFADRDAIFVIRAPAPGDGPARRVRFRWEWLTSGDPRALGFKLRDHDVVYVE